MNNDELCFTEIYKPLPLP